ncbi:MAG: PAS domain-containing protein [Chitinophagales bacterium]|nr:PAS domain-containing protein [Chitinophagales bacterium]
MQLVGLIKNLYFAVRFYFMTINPVMIQDKLNDAAFKYYLSDADRESPDGVWIYKIVKPMPLGLSPAKQIDHIYQFAYLYDCNDAMAKMYGCEHAEEFIGKRLSETLPHTEQNIEFLLAFINSGYILAGAESQEIDEQGRTKHFLNTFKGILEDGFLTGTIGFQKDIIPKR